MGNMCCLLCPSEIWIGVVKLFLALLCVLLAHEIPCLKKKSLGAVALDSAKPSCCFGVSPGLGIVCVCVTLCLYVCGDKFVF